MGSVVLRIVAKQGFDITTEGGKNHFDAFTLATGEEVPLEQDRYFFARRVTTYRLSEVGDIILELDGVGITTIYSEDTDWFLWTDILEIGLTGAGGDLGPYGTLAADIETFFRADRRDLLLTGNERDYARFTQQVSGEDKSGNLFL